MKIFEKSIKEKIEEAKRNPVAIFSIIYPYLLVVGLAIGILYLNKFNVPRPLPEVVASGIEDLKLQEAKTIPPVDVMTFKNPSQELISKGKKLFDANCSSCHGQDGRGDGPASAGLNPPPRNYTSNEEWKNGRRISDIYKTLQEGIPGSAMASYTYLNPEDIFALAEYIRSAFINDPPQDTDSDLKNLNDLYNLSQGKQTPAQIPTEYAEEFIIRENNAKYQKILKAINSISKDTLDEGSRLFNKIAEDKVKALTVLDNSLDWRSNQQRFINIVINEVGQDVFNGKVFYLTNDQWNILYNYLNKYI
jgi:mono/diheme cytochrome c family protein